MAISKTFYGDFKRAKNETRKGQMEAGKNFELYQVKKDGGLYKRPHEESCASRPSRFTEEEAIKIKDRLEGLNPGKEWRLVKIG
jgi:hypothetical protein